MTEKEIADLEILKLINSKGALSEESMYDIFKNYSKSFTIDWETFYKTMTYLESNWFIVNKEGKIIEGNNFRITAIGKQRLLFLEHKFEEYQIEKAKHKRHLYYQRLQTKWQVWLIWPAFVLGLFGATNSILGFWKTDNTKNISQDPSAIKSTIDKQKDVSNRRDTIKTKSSLKTEIN